MRFGTQTRKLAMHVAKLTSAVFTSLIAGLTLSTAVSANAADTTSPSAQEQRLQWWREARFGIFIHWGPVALKGAEISWTRANSNNNCPNKGEIPVAVYDNLYKEFSPTNFKRNFEPVTARAVRLNILDATEGSTIWEIKVQ